MKSAFIQLTKIFKLTSALIAILRTTYRYMPLPRDNEASLELRSSEWPAPVANMVIAPLPQSCVIPAGGK